MTIVLFTVSVTLTLSLMIYLSTHNDLNEMYTVVIFILIFASLLVMTSYNIGVAVTKQEAIKQEKENQKIELTTELPEV